jgi:uncharacterized protein (TIGR02118 family)
MPTKITVIYENPRDPKAFESDWRDRVTESAKRLPGLERLETSKVWPKEDGSATPAFRMIDMYFADYESASSVLHTQEGIALFGILSELAVDGAKFLFSDVEARGTYVAGQSSSNE